MSEANKSVVVGFLDECINQANPDAVDRYLTEDYLDHDRIPDFPPGREGERLGLQAFHKAFTGLRADVEDVIGEGDRVVTRTTLSGRHTGDLFGSAPSGRELTWTSVDITIIAGGRMAEHWALSNLMEQITAAEQGE